MTAPTITRSKVAAVLAVAVFALTACGSSTDSPADEATQQSGTPRATGPSLTAVGRRIDWSAVKEGDEVPMEAFVEPTARPAYAKPLAVQERRLKNRDRVTIPSMNAVAPIANSPVVNGNAVIPKGGQVGWITTTARPGAASGVTVLAGHLTDGPRGADRGPLWGAEELPRGSLIRVVWHGKTTVYTVTKVTKHARNGLPPTLFDPNGPNRIALITCTGPYVGRDGDGDGDVDSFWLSRNAVIWAKRIR